MEKVAKQPQATTTAPSPGESNSAEETERTKSSQPPSVSQQATPPAAASGAAPAVVSNDTEPIAAGSTPNPPAIPKASTGATVSTTSQPLDPGSEKRKRGRPKGSTKKVTAPVTNSLILPTSAPTMGHSMLMGGWLGATMMGQEYDMAKKSKKPKTAANGAKDLQLVPMSLIVQPNQDITEELMRVARENDCSVCVLCAHGAVPGVTLKQCLTGVVTSTKGPMELMTLNGLVSPQRIVTGGFLNATLSTSGGMICGSVVGDFQALIHVHVVIGLLKPQAEVAAEPPSTPAAAVVDNGFRAPVTSSLPLA